MKNTTMVTVFVRKEGRPVEVWGRIPGTQGCAHWLGGPPIILQPGDANSFWIGDDQDLLISEVKQ